MNTKHMNSEHMNAGNASLTGKHAPERKICWRITRHCNLHCAHCLAGHGNDVRRDLTAHEQNEGFVQIARAGVTRITWTGGEPTQCKNLPHLLGLCHEGGVRTVLTTNGLALRGHILDALDPTTDVLRFSVDGLEPTHNKVRGGNYFYKTLANIRRCGGLGLRAEANVSVMADNVEEIPALLPLLAEAGVSKVVLLTLMARESAVDNGVRGPSALQAAELARRVATFSRANPGIGVQLNNYGQQEDAYIVVESDGEIFLCWENAADRSFGSLTGGEGERNLCAALSKQTLAHRQTGLTMFKAA